MAVAVAAAQHLLHAAAQQHEARAVDVEVERVERMFAAKPASVKIKTRALKKLKDAAL